MLWTVSRTVPLTVPAMSYPERSTYKTAFLPPPEVAIMLKLLDPILDVEVKAWGGHEQVGRCVIMVNSLLFHLAGVGSQA